MLRKTSQKTGPKTGPRIGAERAVRVVCIAAAFLTAFTVPGCSGEANASDAGVSAQTVPERDGATVEVRGPPANRAWVIFGTDTIVAEIARTPDERAQGLIYRDELPAGTGMLFVFEDVQLRSFWMANTYVALDIAYIDVSYVIVDIQQLEPLVTDSKASAASCDVRVGGCSGMVCRARYHGGEPGTDRVRHPARVLRTVIPSLS